MIRALAGFAVVAAMSLPAQGQVLNMSGTWELVREKSSPRPAKLCNPNSWIAGLTGEPCVRAMPRLVVDEAPDRFTVTGAVPSLRGPKSVTPGVSVDPVTVALADAFAPLGAIDRAVSLAIRSTDAIVVRVFRPAPDGTTYCGAWSTFGSGIDYPAEMPGPGRDGTGTGGSGSTALSAPARQCLEVRFTLDRSGGLTIDADEELWPRKLHQVYRRVK